MSLELLLQRLQGVSQTRPNSWEALCPLHSDTRPSLKVDVVQRDGRPFPLIRCQSCGPIFYELTRLLGVPPYTLFDGLRLDPGSKHRKKRKPGRRPKPLRDSLYELVDTAHDLLMGDPLSVALLLQQRGISTATLREHRIGILVGTIIVPVYEQGQLVNVRRYVPSWQRETSNQPKWTGQPGVPRTLYPDPKLMKNASWILLAEGELDALIARQHGLPAWSQTAGANSALVGYWHEYFAGKNVAIAYDVDEAGWRGAVAVARQLLDWGCKVKIIHLGLDRGEDLTDWFVKYDRSEDDLLQLIRSTPSFVGDQ